MAARALGVRQPPFIKEDTMSSFHTKILTLLTLAVADSLLTVFLVVKGFGEANPLMNWYMQQTSVVWMAVTKIALTAFLLFLIHKKEIAERHLNWAIPTYLILFFAGVIAQWIFTLIN